MSGMISRAIGALLQENAGLVSSAKALGDAATMRIHRKQQCVDLATGGATFTWQIEFQSKQDLESFHNAVQEIVGLVAGEGGE
jgi:hypothetical protein